MAGNNMRIVKTLLWLLLLTVGASAQSLGLKVCETGASPAACGNGIKEIYVTPGSLTISGQKATITIGGSGGGTGDVVGPGSSTDNAVARFDLATGKLIQDSVVLIGDTGNITGVGTLNTHTIPGGTGTFALTSQLPDGANPTASVGLAAVNGAAATFMRSDGAPALSQSITPTWTGAHAFSNTITQTSNSATAFESGPNGGTNPVLRLVNNVASAATGISITGNAAGSGVTFTALSSGANEGMTFAVKGSANIGFTANRVSATSFQGTGSAAFITANSGHIRLGVSSRLTAGSSSDSAVSIDSYFRRFASASWGFGDTDADTNALIVAQSLNVQGLTAGGTSNQAGKDWTLNASQSKGTGNGGAIIFRTTPAGSSGTSLNSYATAFTIAPDGVIYPKPYTHATLPTPVNGDGGMVFCSDCTIASPCASGGNGAIAKRLNGAWVCN